MIKTFRERIRESVQEINKEFNSNFTINELERRLGTSVTPYVVKHTLSELKMEELEHISGGVNVYNPKLITSAVLALAMATGCVSTAASTASSYKGTSKTLVENYTPNIHLNEEVNENRKDFKQDKEIIKNAYLSTLDELENKKSFIVPPAPPLENFDKFSNYPRKVNDAIKEQSNIEEEISNSKIKRNKSLEKTSELGDYIRGKMFERRMKLEDQENDFEDQEIQLDTNDFKELEIKKENKEKVDEKVKSVSRKSKPFTLKVSSKSKEELLKEARIKAEKSEKKIEIPKKIERTFSEAEKVFEAAFRKMNLNQNDKGTNEIQGSLSEIEFED